MGWGAIFNAQSFYEIPSLKEHYLWERVLGVSSCNLGHLPKVRGKCSRGPWSSRNRRRGMFFFFSFPLIFDLFIYFFFLSVPFSLDKFSASLHVTGSSSHCWILFFNPAWPRWYLREKQRLLITVGRVFSPCCSIMFIWYALRCLDILKATETVVTTCLFRKSGYVWFGFSWKCLCVLRWFAFLLKIARCFGIWCSY